MSSTKEKLLALLASLENLNREKLFQLLVIVEHKGDKFHMEAVRQLLLRRADVESLFQASIQQQRLEEDVDEEAANSFVSLARIFELESVLMALGAPHILLLYDIVSERAPRQHQVLVFRALHTQLAQMSDNVLVQVSRILGNLQGEELKREMRRLVPLPPDLFFLYEPLRLLFRMKAPELLSFHHALGSLVRPSQLEALASVMQLPNYDALLLRSIFAPLVLDDPEMAFGEQMQLGEDCEGSEDVDEEDVADGPALRLQVIEQPPRACVYRRLQKPAPMVKVLGEDMAVEGRLELALILMTQNNMEECGPGYVTGVTVYPVVPGKVVEFKRLKVQQTSKQNGETPFLWAFELREHREGQEEPIVLHRVMSEPFNVVSHSSQLKKKDTTPAPVVQEVIPAYGFVAGGTKVVLLGENFVNVPAVRVRFGDTDVMASVRSTRTIVCHTPHQDSPGLVNVSVSSDGRKFGKKVSSYEYVLDAMEEQVDEEDSEDEQQQQQQHQLPQHQMDIGDLQQWPSGSDNLDLRFILKDSSRFAFRMSNTSMQLDEED